MRNGFDSAHLRLVGLYPGAVPEIFVAGCIRYLVFIFRMGSKYAQVKPIGEQVLLFIAKGGIECTAILCGGAVYIILVGAGLYFPVCGSVAGADKKYIRPFPVHHTYFPLCHSGAVLVMKTAEVFPHVHLLRFIPYLYPSHKIVIIRIVVEGADAGNQPGFFTGDLTGYRAAVRVKGPEAVARIQVIFYLLVGNKVHRTA